MEKDKLYGNTEARLFTPPKRELKPETSLGFAMIEYAETILKLTLYPWQKWALIHMFEIEGDLDTKWSFRFRIMLLFVARQNGKTVLSKVIASFFLNVLEVQNVLGTSLSVDKSLEVLNDVIDIQESTPALQPEIEKVVRANGGNKLILKGKRTYKIAALGKKAGRGDSNDLVLLDELREHRNWESWGATLASTNARPNAVIIAFSNAGDPGSVVLRQLRSQAVAEIAHDDTLKYDFGGADADNLGLFEWSAEDGCVGTEPEQIAKANPSLGYSISLSTILAEAKTMPENQYRSECLCQTVETLLPEPFPKGAWHNLLDETSTIAPESELYYGIDMSVDRTTVSIAVCGLRDDGNYHIECIAKRSGLDWAIDWFRERAIKNPMKLAFQGRGAPVTSLAEQICSLPGIQRCPIEGPDLSNGWARFYDSIAAGEPVPEGETERRGVKTYHLSQPVLDTPAKTMQLKNLGNGLTLPNRDKSPDDISPLFAAAMAFAAATKMSPYGNRKIYESAYTKDYTITFI